MRLLLLCLGAACASIAGCATKPPPASSEVALILWPRPDTGCDFEHPDRDNTLAINTDRTTAFAAGRRSDAMETSIYMVRDASLMQRPRAGDRACLAVLRGPAMGRKDAVLGFDVRFPGAFRAEITPAYARLAQPLSERRGADDMNVSVAFVSGLQTVSGRQATASASFDLGPVTRRGSQRSGMPLILDLPETPSTSMTRLGAIVREAGAGQSSAIPPDLMDQALEDGARLY